jgi:hypothetical protein
MNGRRLDPGELPREERRSRRERHLLALTGGGYRGLFTAEIIAAAEAESGKPLASRFDMIAGTSIGGILAIALACDVPGRDLSALVREHGPANFKPRPPSFAGISRFASASSTPRRRPDPIGRPRSGSVSPLSGRVGVRGSARRFHRDEWDEWDKRGDRSPLEGS